ncbi:MAG: PAS domain-containing protein [Nitrospirales bacterium]|nr:PAS domain-containing protein [Nitrospirales bacterium]
MTEKESIKDKAVTKAPEKKKSPAPGGPQGETKATAGGEEPRTAKDFHVVGIGASAGGLEALEQFFSNMPSDSGMAFILVPHLDPTHKSMLGDILKRDTSMPVSEAEDGMAVMPNSIYIIPPNKDMAIMNSRLQLLEPNISRGIRHPIDFFFRSLAQDFRDKAICIVLSGTGTEGTLGLKEIKGEGGLVLAQDSGSAAYPGMPESAIATDLVDYIMPAAKMPEQLLAYIKRRYIQPAKKTGRPGEKTTEALQKILVLVRGSMGNDFSLYKQNMIQRRVERRMAVNQIETISSYINYLRTNTREIEVLQREFLIRVTNFFRDQEAFESLAKTAFPPIFKDKPADYTVRIWVPGCSTGEEAYSLAILAYEYMQKLKNRLNVQIFATDIDSGAIDIARSGVYPESISVDVSPRRLSRFFTKQGNTFKIRNEIREMVVFALQNIIKDPPFSKVDLISCRNVLIYMGAELQKKVIPVFHYALNPNGFLFLGSSETTGGFADYFRVVDKKCKIFQSKRFGTVPPVTIDIRQTFPSPGSTPEMPVLPLKSGDSGIREMIESMLLHQYSPACVVINEGGDILYIHGRTGKFLEPTSGKPAFNILEMAREGLRLDLRKALRKARSQESDIVMKGLEVKTDGGFQRINLEVKQAKKPENLKGLMVVLFHELPEVREHRPADLKAIRKEMLDERSAELEQELKETKERLQTTIEEFQTSNEELKSANEELQSSNEELQSMNEELETSREELQSVNEELVTVNAEVQTKMEELAHSYSDINNLLANIQTGILFLDRELRIRRFTPSIVNVINLIETDLGRPLTDIATKLDTTEVVRDVAEVLKSLIPSEKLVQQKNNSQWYLMSITPYRTLENVIDGVVLTFTDVTELRKARLDLAEALGQSEIGRSPEENPVQNHD